MAWLCNGPHVPADVVPPIVSGPLLAGTFLVLVWLEQRYPLRRSVEPKLRRTARNLAVATFSAGAVHFVELPAILPLARWVEAGRWGLLGWAPLPTWLHLLLAVVFMDYTLYGWHVLTHRVPFLWRFHVVHHVDLDLDASTALRFHFAEIVISIGWRIAQVVLIGVPPLALSAWQTATLVSIMFHHANVRLPIAAERRLNRFIVTPRMHGIHHSTVREETDSNWSSGLTLWDWLHGTLRLDVPQEEVTIGVPAYRHPREVTLGRLLAMPFGRTRPSWELPGGGRPARAAAPGPSLLG
ncbi:MAG: sterol desaturase family protein [Deltaproteobacteria bacterium]|nr:MAG: sterol desaturase family protein [Deltaproteobacteria bacterium]